MDQKIESFLEQLDNISQQDKLSEKSFYSLMNNFEQQNFLKRNEKPVYQPNQNKPYQISPGTTNFNQEQSQFNQKQQINFSFWNKNAQLGIHMGNTPRRQKEFNFEQRAKNIYNELNNAQNSQQQKYYQQETQQQPYYGPQLVSHHSQLIHGNFYNQQKVNQIQQRRNQNKRIPTVNFQGQYSNYEESGYSGYDKTSSSNTDFFKKSQQLKKEIPDPRQSEVGKLLKLLLLPNIGHLVQQLILTVRKHKHSQSKKQSKQVPNDIEEHIKKLCIHYEPWNAKKDFWIKQPISKINSLEELQKQNKFLREKFEETQITMEMIKDYQNQLSMIKGMNMGNNNMSNMNMTTNQQQFQQPYQQQNFNNTNNMNMTNYQQPFQQQQPYKQQNFQTPQPQQPYQQQNFQMPQPQQPYQQQNFQMPQPQQPYQQQNFQNTNNMNMINYQQPIQQSQQQQQQQNTNNTNNKNMTNNQQPPKKQPKSLFDQDGFLTNNPIKTKCQDFKGSLKTAKIIISDSSDWSESDNPGGKK